MNEIRRTSKKHEALDRKGKLPYISMTNLGKNGRLGNQIFQFCFLYAFARMHNRRITIPEKTDLQACFTLETDDDVITQPPMIKFANQELLDYHLKNSKAVFRREKTFEFNPDHLVQDTTDPINFSGYYQSWRYWIHRADELWPQGVSSERVLLPLTFKAEIQEAAEKVMQGLAGELVSIHIRRGDYLNTTCHPAVDADYIARAKQAIGVQNPTYVVFSDDIAWCKENRIGDIYIEGTNHHVDLCAMKSCHHNIISNSTFSWWAAMFNTNPTKKIVAPKKWFSGQLASTSTKDLIPSEWISV